ILGNLRVDVNTQAPRQTTGVRGAFNLDSNETELETVGSRFGTDGAAVGVTQVGLQEATTTVTNLGAVATPIDFTAQPTSFQISLAGSSPASGNGTVSINLNTSVANSVQDVVNLINSAIFSAATPINVQAVANGGNIEFR